jgi:hypothetical protein
MPAPRTFIAPGQRFVRPGRRPWYVDNELTVLHVGKDALGSLWVTYRDQDGEDLTGPADWFEEAVTAGEIVPAVSSGGVARC